MDSLGSLSDDDHSFTHERRGRHNMLHSGYESDDGSIGRSGRSHSCSHSDSLTSWSDESNPSHGLGSRGSFVRTRSTERAERERGFLHGSNPSRGPWDQLRRHHPWDDSDPYTMNHGGMGGRGEHRDEYRGGHDHREFGGRPPSPSRYDYGRARFGRGLGDRDGAWRGGRDHDRYGGRHDPYQVRHEYGENPRHGYGDNYNDPRIPPGDYRRSRHEPMYHGGGDPRRPPRGGRSPEHMYGYGHNRDESPASSEVSNRTQLF